MSKTGIFGEYPKDVVATVQLFWWPTRRALYYQEAISNPIYALQASKRWTYDCEKGYFESLVLQ